MERGAKGISNGLENMPMMRSNGLIQDLMMACEQGWHRVGIFLREPCAAFDVGEEEGDGAGGKIRHTNKPRLPIKSLLPVFYFQNADSLMLEMNEYPSEVLIILLDAVIQLFDMTLIQEPQDLLFELSASLARDDFHKADSPLDRFLHYAVKLRIDLVTAIVDVVKVEFKSGHGLVAGLSEWAIDR
jgi:hypothetical protein